MCRVDRLFKWVFVIVLDIVSKRVVRGWIGGIIDGLEFSMGIRGGEEDIVFWEVGLVCSGLVDEEGYN